ncbi:MAG TPA: hypothetical protein VGY54_04050 [Polyangiaceae bacterium]|nr:hypothetical protein [Polyangiaceae bacterium]
MRAAKLDHCAGSLAARSGNVVYVARSLAACSGRLDHCTNLAMAVTSDSGTVTLVAGKSGDR